MTDISDTVLLYGEKKYEHSIAEDARIITRCTFGYLDSKLCYFEKQKGHKFKLFTTHYNKVHTTV